MVGGMDSTRLTNLAGLARELRLPAAWLRQQADEGTIPSITIGRKRRFNPAAVAGVLAERAAREGLRHAAAKED